MGEAAVVGPWRWRRCLITTPIEIAARTAIAIRIGTSGEELLLLACEAGVPAFWPPCCTGVPDPWLWLPPGLPCPVPPPLPAPGTPPSFEDDPFPGDSLVSPSEAGLPAVSVGADAPPLSAALATGECLWGVDGFPPSALGMDSVYCTQLELTHSA